MNKVLRILRLAVSALIALLGLVIIGVAVMPSAEGRGLAKISLDTPAALSSVSYPNCRFGLGGDAAAFNVAPLNSGWYMDWLTHLNPYRPQGAEYFQVVRLKSISGGYVFTPTLATLQATLDQNPGATWLIGNEPDSPVQDNVRPEIYARAYHDLYSLIKQRDPSAQVGAGNIVQPTPLRMKYLDRVLSAYQQQYGTWLPADLWSIHSYILREIDVADAQACQPNQACSEPPQYAVWGAYIPLGMTETRGTLYTFSDMFSLPIFQQRLLDFRGWMRDRGYGNKPLYITEYGTLFPYPPYLAGDPEPFLDENGLPMTEARTAAFMTGTFNLLRQLTSASAGYAPDGGHVVQRWLWYSIGDTGFGGPLFDPTTQARRPLGDVFASYTSAISPVVDLQALSVRAEPAGPVTLGGAQTVTLKALVGNTGNISITRLMTVAFYSGQPLSGNLIDSRVITSPLNGCGSTIEVNVKWSNLVTGVYPIYSTIQGDSSITDINLANNVATGVVVIVPPRVYLPLIHNPYPRIP